MTPRKDAGAPPPAVPRAYLLAGVFTTGASVLALELVGARVIGPFYGSSLYCWAAVITVTMVALAAGYAFGGRAADRDPSPGLFPRLVVLSGLAIAVIPLLRFPVLRHTAWMGVRLGALTSAAVLLGPALAFLGALGPVAVRLTARDLASVGTRAGEVMAVSTLGSVLGAVAAGFFLIPSLPVPAILHGLAALLFCLAAAGTWTIRRRAPVWTAGAAIAAGLFAGRPAPALAAGVLFSRQSPYGEVKVVDSGDRRYLLVDGVTQSIARSGEADSPYLHTLELSALLGKGPRALFIGVGAGQLPATFEKIHAIAADVVELDPVMLEAARLFGFEGGRGGVFVEDGRAFLERGGGGRYGVVILDAFVGENPPYQLFTAEAFAAARRALEPGGVLGANLVCLVDGARGDAWIAVYKTMRSVFPEVRAYLSAPPYKGLANVVFFASDAPIADALSRAQAAARPAAREGLAFALGHELIPSSADLASASVLTDDHAPVEYLLARTALAWRGVVQDTAGEELLR